MAPKRKRTHKQQPHKYWAFMPKLGELPAEKSITDYNLEILARDSIVGIAQTRKLAKQRRDERAARVSELATPQEYQTHVYRHFGKEHPLGAVAILGYSVQPHEAPQEWHIETYFSDEVAPIETQVLPFEHTTSRGISMNETLRLQIFMGRILRAIEQGGGLE